ncbi:hypothetical protein HPB50_019484 [Hyalomma asiaticum]|uniref:Uncharacterized protein n=1 Tax=Hyalomma asiaticum TaxID=266040 RepID=A0ACB7SIW9_HYAAI|nr:hypothetical protein HPB50_019484 [Hyalomma asiaticum]
MPANALVAMFFASRCRAWFNWLKRRRVAVAMLLVAGVAVCNVVQLYNRHVAGLKRKAKLGTRFHEPPHWTSTRPTTMLVQQPRRPLLQTLPKPDGTSASGHDPTTTSPVCIEDTFPSPAVQKGDPRAACLQRRRRMRCNYTAENGIVFLVHENFVASDDCPPAYAENVTLVTHGTYGFLRHVAGLCDRWQGPLSVAVFAPGSDIDGALTWIDFLRRCGRNPCVKRSVTWHLVYDREHTPEPGASHSSNFSDTRGSHSCSSAPSLEDSSSYRRRQRIPYPANVLRNVARKLAPTHYVLVQDMRLYPSTDIVPRFLNHVAEQRRLLSFRSDGNEVYVLPVFAMTSLAHAPEALQQPPRSMTQLRESLRSGTVVLLNDSSHSGAQWSRSFYSAIMNASSESNRTDGRANVQGEHLRIHMTVKRSTNVLAWEPVFIGTRDDPAYNEVLAWEGGRDRVSQGYVMCLENYDFHIVEDAFVVRVPGLAKSEGAVVRINSNDPSLLNEFNFRRLMDSIGLRYPAEQRKFC